MLWSDSVRIARSSIVRGFCTRDCLQMLWSDLDWDMEKLERIVQAGPSWPQHQQQVIHIILCLESIYGVMVEL